ncbi:MAG: HAD-IA family hydrolase, partial [Armatimonadetes bacterium]|nr:HAD-IA family hydrolase [Armatimonadota bacterium]
MTLSGIKAVFLDAGNTLVHLDHEFLATLTAAAGHPVPAERLMEAEYAGRQALDRVHTGRAPPPEDFGVLYFVALFTMAGIPERVARHLFTRVRAADREASLWHVVLPGTVDVLRELRRRGYRVAVVSNADGRVADTMARVGIAPHLSFVVDSYVVGVEKPDPRIFHLAVERAGVAPGEAVHVGDTYSVDYLGARVAGLLALL